jgi:hypothetical protein
MLVSLLSRARGWFSLVSGGRKQLEKQLSIWRMSGAVAGAGALQVIFNTFYRRVIFFTAEDAESAEGEREGLP